VIVIHINNSLFLHPEETINIRQVYRLSFALLWHLPAKSSGICQFVSHTVTGIAKDLNLVPY